MCHDLGVSIVPQSTRIASTEKLSHRQQGRVPNSGRDEVAKGIVMLTTNLVMRLVAEVIVLVDGIVVLVFDDVGCDLGGLGQRARDVHASFRVGGSRDGEGLLHPLGQRQQRSCSW